MHSNDYLLNIENDIKELEKVLINEKNPQKYLLLIRLEVNYLQTHYKCILLVRIVIWR